MGITKSRFLMRSAGFGPFFVGPAVVCVTCLPIGVSACLCAICLVDSAFMCLAFVVLWLLIFLALCVRMIVLRLARGSAQQRARVALRLSHRIHELQAPSCTVECQ